MLSADSDKESLRAGVVKGSEGHYIPQFDSTSYTERFELEISDIGH